MCNTSKPLSIDGDRYELSDSISLALEKEFELDGLFDRYIKELFNDRKVTSKTNKALFHATYQELKAGLQEGFGQVTAKVEYGSPNFEMLKNLQINTGVFSAFKNHAMIKEITALLKDQDGNLRSFEVFKAEALKIDGQYRKSWLKVEYDTAVRTSRMAAQWERIQRTKQLYPNLRYVRSRAANPRQDHLSYVDIVRPVDDSFWKTNYPPNGWGCECGVEQTDADPTDIPQGIEPVPADFAFNAGILGQAFDLKQSGYSNSVSSSDLPKLLKFAKAEVNADIVRDLQYQNLYKSKKSGSVEAHPLAFNNSDFNPVLSAARELANKGHKVKILPDLGDSALRSELLPLEQIKPGKNPDYLIGKDVFELKSVNTASGRAIKGAIDSARAQCNNILIDIPEEVDISLEAVERAVYAKLNTPEMKSFGKVWIKYKGRLLTDLFKSR